MIHKILKYFDKLEDQIRGRLSRYPIIYSLIGGTAIVLFWRGVWITADQIVLWFPESYHWVDGPISLMTSILLLLATGLFVSFFVSDRIILSGIKQEKKLVEKTESEVRQESDVLSELTISVRHIDDEIKNIEDKITKV